MDLGYYVFAVYVFLLMCVVIWLLGRVLKKSRKANGGEHTSREKERKLFTLYQNVEDMLSGFEEYVEEAKTETDKSMAKMRDMLEETKSLVTQLKAMQSCAPNGAAGPNAAEAPKPVYEENAPQIEQTDNIHIVKPAAVQPQPLPPRQTAERNGSKTGDKVAELYSHGLTQNEIARQLGISVREVALALKISNA